uniref:Uncharacterized protein n=1 Tax=Rhizophora mucronata TaxID=61149 RepID=A0A2P2N0Z2_RHIMU
MVSRKSRESNNSRNDLELCQLYFRHLSEGDCKPFRVQALFVSF